MENGSSLAEEKERMRDSENERDKEQEKEKEKVSERFMDRERRNHDGFPGDHQREPRRSHVTSRNRLPKMLQRTRRSEEETDFARSDDASADMCFKKHSC